MTSLMEIFRNMMNISVDLFEWLINFSIKKLLVVVLKMKISQTKKYLKNYKKQFSRKIQEKKVHSPFIGNIWCPDMQLISKFNKGIRFLLCVIDIFCKYAWVIPLKDKKDSTITNAF